MDPQTVQGVRLVGNVPLADLLDVCIRIGFGGYGDTFFAPPAHSGQAFGIAFGSDAVGTFVPFLGLRHTPQNHSAAFVVGYHDPVGGYLNCTGERVIAGSHATETDVRDALTQDVRAMLRQQEQFVAQLNGWYVSPENGAHFLVTAAAQGIIPWRIAARAGSAWCPDRIGSTEHRSAADLLGTALHEYGFSGPAAQINGTLAISNYFRLWHADGRIH